MRKPAQDIVLQEFRIKEPAELLAFLTEKEVRKSRNAVKSLLTHKQIKVNGKLVTQHNYQLTKGDKLQVMKYNQARKRNPLKGLSIIFEDEYLIVVEKESGTLSIATDKEREKTAFNILNQYVKSKGDKEDRIYLIHRIDREMSGLMVFAKDPETQAVFHKNWDKVVTRYNYIAILEGQLDPPQGTIKSWLTENKNYVVFSSSSNNGGLEAITQYKTLDANKHYSMVSFDLVTRRKNQIRAQMNQMKHSIVGDRKYGAKGNPIKRIALHGEEMTIIHPVSGQKLEFRYSLPKAMQELMKPTNKNKPE